MEPSPGRVYADMEKKILLLTALAAACCLTGASALEAQPPHPALKRFLLTLHKQQQQPLAFLRSFLRRATAKAQKKAIAQLKESPLPQPQRTVFLLRDATNTYKTPFYASGFVIEEIFEGKRCLWGVTAKHITDLFDSAFEAVFYVNGKPVVVPVQVEFAGAQAGLDLSLLKMTLPAEGISPLPIGQDLQPGQMLHSYGYSRAQFYHAPARKTLKNTPQRVYTSYAFLPHSPASGYCGAPLVNAQGKLAAIHTGSTGDKSSSFAVPASELHTLLAAYRGRKEGERPLLFNGEKIGSLKANQVIFSVYAQKDGKITSQILTQIKTTGWHPWNNKEPVSPKQLEKLISWQDADEVYVVTYEEPAAYFQPFEDPCRQTIYRYHLATREISVYSFTGILSPN